MLAPKALATVAIRGLSGCIRNRKHFGLRESIYGISMPERDGIVMFT